MLGTSRAQLSCRKFHGLNLCPVVPLKNKHARAWPKDRGLVRKLQESKTRVLWTQFLQKHSIVLGMCFCAPPQGSRYEFISDYSLLLLFASMPVWRTVVLPSTMSLWLLTVWTHENLPHVTFLNLQRINCLLLWRKVAAAWDFSLPCF